MRTEEDGGSLSRAEQIERALPLLPVAFELLVELLDGAVDVHRAKLRPAHRAKLGPLEVLVGERLVVERLSVLRIDRETKLLLPVEGVPRPTERVVAIPRPRAVARNVGGVRGDLVGDEPLLHVVLVGEPE